LPRKALTSASVERIKPPTKGQVDHFDKGYPGLAMRVSYGGGKSFVFFYRIAGKLRRMSLGTYPAISLAEAREAWRDARLDVAAGRDPAQLRKREKPATDFEGVSREWLRRDQKKNRSYNDVAGAVERELIPAWGHRSINEITRRDILDLIDTIADRGAVTMARRVQAYVHRLFRWAVGRGIIDTNPASDLPKPGSETKRDRVLTDDELLTVWKGAVSLGWPFGDATRLLILTGARREEISRLRWGEIFDDAISLSGERTKNGQPHTIPLSKPAREIIASLPHIAGSDFVFTTTGTTPISGWSRAKDKLGDVASWRIHDLRRTTATGLQRLGTALPVTESILGHVAGSRAGIVGIYQRHDYADEKRAALEEWAKHVETLLGTVESKA
jgi:integrase